MALAAGSEYVVRSDGNDNNGYVFKDLDPGTSVDYTDQASPQASPSDLAMTTGGTTLTSASNPFTAAMVGNGIQITSGTNFTAGLYQITGYNDAGSVEIDRDATNGSNASSGQGYIGGARSTLDDAFFEALQAGDIVYIKNGTYTPAANIDVAQDGDSTARIKMHGYNSSKGDNPDGDSRPLIDTSNKWDFGGASYWEFRNLRLNISDGGGFETTNSWIINCRVENDRVNASDCAIQCTGYSVFIMDCEVVCKAGCGIKTNQFTNVIGCKIHGCADEGIWINHDFAVILDNIISNCEQGISVQSSAIDYHLIKNNTIVGCDDAIYWEGGVDDPSLLTILNNIISDNIDGIISSQDRNGDNFLDYNTFYNNSGNDVSNVTKGPNALATDPQYGQISVISGTTATTSGTTLTDGSKNFSNVENNKNYVRITGGSGISTSPSCFKITGHDTTSLTLDASPGDSSGDVEYTVVAGDDYTLDGASGSYNTGFANRFGE